MDFKFSYLPLTGPLSGKSFEDQTARAINEVGQFAADAKDLSDEALARAKAAASDAGKALDKANEASSTANRALESATDAGQTADDAVRAAQQAQATADNALTRAEEGVSQATQALATASTAIDKADQANVIANANASKINLVNAAAETAQKTGEQALATATLAVYYTPTEEAIDPDSLLEPGSLFLHNPVSTHLPVAEKGFLTVRTDKNDTDVFQLYQTQNNVIYSRTGSLTSSEVIQAGTDSITLSYQSSETVAYELDILSGGDGTALSVARFTGASHATGEATSTALTGHFLVEQEAFNDGAFIVNGITLADIVLGQVTVTHSQITTEHGMITASDAVLDNGTLDVTLSYTWTDIETIDTGTFTAWNQLATQAAVDTKQDKLTFDATPTAGSANPVTSGGVKAAIDSAISTVYKWQGSVNTVADLPSSGNAVGDVYNVVSSGANYGWTGSAWDNLGGIDAVDPVPIKDSDYPVASGGVFTALAGKQDNLTIDAAPVTGSTNPVASGGVADALSKIQESLVFDDTPTAGSTNPVTSQGIKTALDQLAVNGAGAPVGTIQYFAMDAPPTGYLKADGTLVSRTVYADLFAAIGTTYGAGDGTTTFALPDLRGEFVRGFDDGRGVDSSRVFGSTQGDAQYPLSDQRITQLERFPATDPVTTADAATFGYRLETSAAMASRPSVSVCGFAPDEGDTVAIMDLVPFNTNPVADEVRPRNVALLACIKAFGVIDNTGSVDLSTLASKDEVAKKQDKLTFDTAPTENSANPVTSGGVYTAIQNSVNAVDLSGYWNTTASGTGVVDHSFLQADAQTASAKTVTLTKQSTKSINLTTSGAVTLDIQAGNETDTAFITLNIQAEAATSLTWPSSVIWIDPDAQAPTWGNAGSFLHVQLCLARTRILASTLYNSEA